MEKVEQHKETVRGEGASVWKGMKGKTIDQGGSATLIDIESGGGAIPHLRLYCN